MAVLRALAWWLAAVTALGVAVPLTAPALAAPLHWPTSAEAVLAASSAAMLGCAGWASVVTTALVVEVLAGRRGRRAPGVPDWVRRLVLGSCGAVLLGAGAAPLAQAAPAGSLDGDAAGPGGAGPSISGLPYPDRATGPAQAPTGAPSPSRPLARPPACVVAVRAGESLWSIAEDHHAGAAAADLARAVDALYTHNRDVVGPDPDLIHPGDRLRLPGPSDAAQPHRCEESR